MTLPDGALIISVLRDGCGLRARRPTRVVEAGDEVLVVLDPGLEDDITRLFVAASTPMADRHVDALIVGGGVAGAAVRRGAARGRLRRRRAARRAASPTRRTSARRPRRATSPGSEDRDACLLHDAAWYARNERSSSPRARA